MCHRVVELGALDEKSLDYQLTIHRTPIDLERMSGFHAVCLLEVSHRKVTVGCMERQREDFEFQLNSTSHASGKTEMDQFVGIFDDQIVAVDYRMAVIAGRQTERPVFPGLNVPSMAVSRSVLE